MKRLIVTLSILFTVLGAGSTQVQATPFVVPIDANDYLEHQIYPVTPSQATLHYSPEGNAVVTRSIEVEHEVTLWRVKWEVENEGTQFETWNSIKVPLSVTLTQTQQGTFELQMPDFNPAEATIYLSVTNPQTLDVLDQRKLAPKSVVKLVDEKSKMVIHHLSNEENDPQNNLENNNGNGPIKVDNIGSPINLGTVEQAMLKIRFKHIPLQASVDVATDGDTHEIDATTVDGNNAADQGAEGYQFNNDWSGWTCSFNPARTGQNPRDLVVILALGLGILIPLRRRFLAAK